jgi:signal transduction histidine kinase
MSNDIFLLIMLGMSGTLLLAGAVIFFYIRYQHRFLVQREALQKKELEHKKHLLYTSIQSQEEERMRISRDLHDHVGSRLSNIRMTLGNMERTADDKDAFKHIVETSKKGIDEVMADIRTISQGLLPPGLSLWGFYHSIEDLCVNTRASSGLNITFTDQTSGELQTLPFETALSLYRVIQEALTNTLKHANANHITITLLVKDKKGIINYSDNGIGAEMNKKTTGLGMYNIESRLSMINASYKVITSNGEGFTLSIYDIPLAQTEPQYG